MFFLNARDSEKFLICPSAKVCFFSFLFFLLRMTTLLKHIILVIFFSLLLHIVFEARGLVFNINIEIALDHDCNALLAPYYYYYYY
jgi:hypothetical protein